MMPRWIGKFPSIKLNRMVGYESLIERDFIYLLDFDPAVTAYQEQPVTIRYQDDNKQRRYTPDFHFVRDGQAYLIECKHHQYMKAEENKLKWDAARRWCDSQGATFWVVTEVMIRTGHRLENVKLLTDHARYTVDVNMEAKAAQVLMVANKAMTVADLMTALSPEQPQAAIVPILYLAYHHQLYIPLDDAPITVSSPVVAGSQSRLPNLLPASLPKQLSI
jgi:hypothetical protein